MFFLILLSIVSDVIGDKASSILNLIILIIFTIDTLHSLWKSDDKWKYIKENPLDFVSIIPFYNGFRVMRIIPLTLDLIRITSIGQKYMLPVLLRLRDSGVGRLFNIFVVVFILLPLPLLWIEPNIKTYEDLIWWEMQTVTTVGYGDIVIKTGMGRIIGMILMILGVGIISAFTSQLTKAIGNPKRIIHRKKDFEIDELLHTTNFSVDELDTIQMWLDGERKKRLNKNPKH